jgi:L,D-transpeptidase catalytic domain
MPRFAIAAITILLGALTPAQAGIVVTVDKSAQRLSVTVDGAQRYQWPVSTARMGYRTPNGTYHPQRLARKWFSREYDWSPMPYSIFFNEGYAIHGSYEISHLGRPASHGCIRLHPDNAALLFALVKERVDDTTIVVTGERPEKAGHMRVRDEERPERHRAHRVHRAHRTLPSEAAAQEEPARTEQPNFFSPPPGSSFHPR